MSGLYVTPGLIDLHVHVYHTPNVKDAWAGDNSVQPDAFSFRTGVTTMVDAGSSGRAALPLDVRVGSPKSVEQLVETEGRRVRPGAAERAGRGVVQLAVVVPLHVVDRVLAQDRVHALEHVAPRFVVREVEDELVSRRR